MRPNVFDEAGESHAPEENDMAVPRRRFSVQRKRKRRSHLSLTAPNLDACPKCLEPKLPHRVCSACGTYKGREVIRVEEEEA